MGDPPLRARLLDALDPLQSLTFSPARHEVGLAKLERVLAEVVLGDVDGAAAGRKLGALLAAQESFETNGVSNTTDRYKCMIAADWRCDAVASRLIDFVGRTIIEDGPPTRPSQ